MPILVVGPEEGCSLAVFVAGQVCHAAREGAKAVPLFQIWLRRLPKREQERLLRRSLDNVKSLESSCYVEYSQWREGGADVWSSKCKHASLPNQKVLEP